MLNLDLVSAQDCLHIDARGLPCPMPLLKLKQALNSLALGHCVKLIASDPNSQQDILKFCEVQGYEVELIQPVPERYEFLVHKI